MVNSPMTETEEFLIDILNVLARGCTRHSFYRGMSPPRLKECERCKEVFIAYQKWLKFCQLNGVE
jgi:hypothetical protein